MVFKNFFLPMNSNTRTNYSNKINSKIHILKTGHIFNNFKAILIFFEINNPVAGNAKKSFLKHLLRFCKYENIEHTNKYIITEVFNFPFPKIDEKFLESKFYPPCSLLLLEFLSEKYSCNKDNDFCYIKKKILCLE